MKQLPDALQFNGRDHPWTLLPMPRRWRPTTPIAKAIKTMSSGGYTFTFFETGAVRYFRVHRAFEDPSIDSAWARVIAGRADSDEVAVEDWCQAHGVDTVKWRATQRVPDPFAGEDHDPFRAEREARERAKRTAYSQYTGGSFEDALRRMQREGFTTSQGFTIEIELD